jgi:hypothetical protein
MEGSPQFRKGTDISANDLAPTRVANKPPAKFCSRGNAYCQGSGTRVLPRRRPASHDYVGNGSGPMHPDFRQEFPHVCLPATLISEETNGSQFIVSHVQDSKSLLAPHLMTQLHSVVERSNEEVYYKTRVGVAGGRVGGGLGVSVVGAVPLATGVLVGAGDVERVGEGEAVRGACVGEILGVGEASSWLAQAESNTTITATRKPNKVAHAQTPRISPSSCFLRPVLVTCRMGQFRRENALFQRGDKALASRYQRRSSKGTASTPARKISSKVPAPPMLATPGPRREMAGSLCGFGAKPARQKQEYWPCADVLAPVYGASKDKPHPNKGRSQQ